MNNTREYYTFMDRNGKYSLVTRDGRVLISGADEIDDYGLRNGTSDFAVARFETSVGPRYIMVDKEGNNVFGRLLKDIDATDFLRGRTNILKVDISGFHSPVKKMYAVRYENGKFNIVQHLGDEQIVPDKFKIQTMLDKFSSLISKIKGKIFRNKDTNNPWVNNVRFALYKDRLEQGYKYRPEKPRENYSFVMTEHGEAVTNKNKEVITPYFHRVHIGFCKTNYFIAKREDGKKAIFHVEAGQVSPWAEYVSSTGLVEGQSGLYILKDKKGAVIMDRFGPVSDRHYNIWEEGIVSGKRPYYMYEDKKFGKRCLNIADIYGRPILDKDYDDIKAFNFLMGNSRSIAVKYEKYSVIDSLLDKEPQYEYRVITIHEDKNGEVLIKFGRELTEEEFERYDKVMFTQLDNDNDYINFEKTSQQDPAIAGDPTREKEVSYNLDL